MMWDMVKLGDCCEVISGGTPSRKKPEFWGGSIAWATPKDISSLDGAVLDTTPEFITEEGLKRSSATILPKGAILFSSRAPIGLVAIAGREMTTNQGFKNLVPGKKVNSGYLYHCMNMMAPRIASLGNGATFKEVSKRVVSSVEIPLPPLSEQKRIAAILDKADAIRRKRKAALDMADEFLRATFLDMFGDPVTNPKGWDVKPLGEVIATIRNGLSPSTKGTYPGKVFTLSAVTGADFLPKAKKEALFDKDPTTYEATSNDFLICRGNGNLKLVGKAKFPKGNYQGITFPDTVIAANVLTEIILPEVLEAQWATFFIRDQIERGARTTNGTHKINQSVIKNIEVAIPDMKAQLAFKKNVQGMSRYLSKTTNAHADTLFASLSQRAFQGKL